MNLTKFAREIHEQSVAHGWWENGDLIEKLTMIHSEISEAVDEYRNARPMVYVLDLAGDEEAVPRYETDWAKFDGRKPEGIAVELLLSLRKRHRRRRRAIRKAVYKMFAWEARHLGKRWLRELMQVLGFEQE